MVLTFTVQPLPSGQCLIRIKWLFNGIDIYRTYFPVVSYRQFKKNGSSMVLTFTGQLFPSGQCSIRIKWFFKSIEFNRLGSFKGYCDLIFLRYSFV